MHEGYRCPPRVKMDKTALNYGKPTNTRARPTEMFRNNNKFNINKIVVILIGKAQNLHP